MKKLISFLLCILLVFSYMSIAVFANDLSDETEKILQSVKERIGDTSEYDNFDSSSYDNNGKKRYNFEWYTSESDSGYKSLSIACSFGGIITRFDEYNSEENRYSEKPSINKISREEALKNAKNLIDKLNPSVSDKLFLEFDSATENLFSNQYRFNIIRKENNIEVHNDGGSVTLNSSADKITSFYLNYTEDVSFVTPEKLISAEEAQKLFGEKLGIELKYISNYDDRKITIVPCYVEKDTNSNKYINAVTGEVFEIQNKIYDLKEESSADMLAMNTAAGGSSSKHMLSEAELSEIEILEDLLSKEEVISILKKNKYLTLPSGFEFTSNRISKDYYSEDYFSRITYKKIREDNHFGSINFTVDAKTGRIKNYSLYDYETEKNSGKIIINKDKAHSYLTEAANSLSETIISEYKETDFYYPENIKEKNYDYYSSITFTRLVNNVPYENDTISVRLNLKTGKIESYQANYTNAEFPSVTDAISEQAALTTLFEKISYEPKYVISRDKAVPVYMLVESKLVRIDANKNILLDYSLKEMTEEVSSYSDISGHYAEKIINKLKAYGIGFNEDKFEPDTDIRQKDYIALLTSAFYRNYSSVSYTTDTDEAYNKAKQNNIIKSEEINPEQTVTRADAAKFMVRALGYEEVALIKDIYTTIFSDVTENTGYANILYGLGIINGDENRMFNPNKALKRAEAAVMIYNYLAK